MSLLAILTFFISACFLFYGAGCLFSHKMDDEFERFGLTKFQRRLTGVLQILGSLGLLTGYALMPELAIFSAGGLSLLMLLGFGVRLKIKDGVIASFPSLFFSVLNFFIALEYYNRFIA